MKQRRFKNSRQRTAQKVAKKSARRRRLVKHFRMQRLRDIWRKKGTLWKLMPKKIKRIKAKTLSAIKSFGIKE